jgi:hypothetical protein
MDWDGRPQDPRRDVAVWWSFYADSLKTRGIFHPLTRFACHEYARALIRYRQSEESRPTLNRTLQSCPHPFR